MRLAGKIEPKTAAHAAEAAFSEALPKFGVNPWEAAAQAAHEFLSRPKVTAGELLWAAMNNQPESWANHPLHYQQIWEKSAQAFLRLAREHGLLEAGE